MNGILTSKDNPLIKKAVSLKGSAKARRDAGLFLIEGLRLCGDALQSGAEIETVFYTGRFRETSEELTEALMQKTVSAYEVSEAVAGRLADTKTPQGVFCLCRLLDKFSSAVTIEKNGNYVGLENISDPQNLGTILRTAEALGFDGVILSEGCCDIYSPKVLRGSMGAVFRLHFWETPDMADFVRARVQAGQQMYASVPSESVRPIQTVDFSGGGVMLIGNEASGLTPATLSAASCQVTIPMNGRAESLNAAAAASILLWEMRRKV